MNDDILSDFIRNVKWEDAHQTPLLGDASRRRYIRLRLNGMTALLMDARDIQDIMAPFVQIANYLRKHGLSAPEIYEVDQPTGLALIEDFGDGTFYAISSMNAFELKELLANAIELLLAFHTLPNEPVIPPYDLDFLRKEVSQFTEWYLPLSGVTCTDDMKAEFLESWNAPLEFLGRASGQTVFVHKDFHGGNLIWQPHRSGIGRIGIIDFQNAKFGSVAYDLISLLYDSRSVMTVELRSCLLERFMNASASDSEVFLELCHIVIVQRHMKILGNFARVYLAESRPEYIRYLPNVWRLIGNSLCEPIFANLKYWLDHHGIIETANHSYGLVLEHDSLRLFPPRA